MTVDTTDNNGVSEVKADDVSLVQSGNLWSGSIIAVEGTHSVNVSSADAAGNVAWKNDTSYTATTPEIVVTDSNLIPNPSLETNATKNKDLPLAWNKYSYGSTSTFTYLTTGGYTGNRCVKVESTAASVDAYWKYDLQPVTGGELYVYSVMYKANTSPEASAEVLLSDGQTMWMYVGGMPTSTEWKKYEAKIFLPPNAVKATIYTGILSSGYLITDDYSLTVAPTHTGFDRALVSITDDESERWYTNAYPIFKKYGLPGTTYIISGDLDSQWTMTRAQFTDFQNLGWEIGSHTVDHPDLTTVSAAQLDS